MGFLEKVLPGVFGASREEKAARVGKWQDGIGEWLKREGLSCEEVQIRVVDPDGFTYPLAPTPEGRQSDTAHQVEMMCGTFPAASERRPLELQIETPQGMKRLILPP